ncbi:MAG: ISAs1 family transposase [Synechococcus sp.]
MSCLLLTRSTRKKTCQTIVESGNHYLAALKGNQPNLFAAVQQQIAPEQEYLEIGKGHGRVERRVTQVCHQIENLPDWPGLQSVIRVQFIREQLLHNMNVVTHKTRYYLCSFSENTAEIAARIRGYWGRRKQGSLCSRCHSGRGQVSDSHDSSRTDLCPSLQLCPQPVSRLWVH